MSIPIFAAFYPIILFVNSYAHRAITCFAWNEAMLEMMHLFFFSKNDIYNAHYQDLLAVKLNFRTWTDGINKKCKNKNKENDWA